LSYNQHSAQPKSRSLGSISRTSGLSNREIAERLVIGERTVDTHLTNVGTKLDLHGRVQITAWAIAHRLASPNP
jgi:FixJ family two-component response regulator